MLSLLLAHPGATLAFLCEGLISRHYASAEEFGLMQGILRELSAVPVHWL